MKDIFIFYYLSFKSIFIFSGKLWRFRTKIWWRKNSS